MGRAAEVPARWIQVWSHCFCSFPAIKNFMAGKKYFRWMRSECRIGNTTGVHLPATGLAAEGPARSIQVWSYYCCPFPAINKFMARNKYFRWMPGDWAGSEIILGSIFRPWVGQLKYLEDEYSCHIIVFAHFGPSKNLWQATNISGGCQVTVPDRQSDWGPTSGHGSGSWSTCKMNTGMILLFVLFLAIKKFMAGKKYFRWMPSDCAGSEIQLGSIFRPQL